MVGVPEAFAVSAVMSGRAQRSTPHIGEVYGLLSTHKILLIPSSTMKSTLNVISSVFDAPPGTGTNPLQ